LILYRRLRPRWFRAEDHGNGCQQHEFLRHGFPHVTPSDFVCGAACGIAAVSANA
jgi:hypothetical protein